MMANKIISVEVLEGGYTEKLRRQLIFTLQDEEMTTDEKYPAIIKLYRMSGPDITIENFCKGLGISRSSFDDAKQYCNFVEEEPELAKSVAPHIIIETASLPKEERKKVSFILLQDIIELKQ